MQCLEASEWLSLHLDHRLTPAEEQTLQDHLAACPSCQMEWQMLQRAHQLFEHTAPAVPPAYFSQRVMTRIHRRTSWLALLRGGLVICLGLAIALAMGLIPLTALSYILTNLLGSPSLVSAIVGVLVRVVNVFGTLLEAIRVILQVVFSSPNWVAILGYLGLVAILGLWWVRLVTHPAQETAEANQP